VVTSVSQGNQAKKTNPQTNGAEKNSREDNNRGEKKTLKNTNRPTKKRVPGGGVRQTKRGKDPTKKTKRFKNFRV